MPKKPVVNLARLEELMREKKWGYGELAAYSGVKYDTVYSLAKGRRPNSNIATLKQIADALDVSVDYLLGQSDDKSPPEGALPQPVRQLVEIATVLPLTRQEELARIAALLAEIERERAALVQRRRERLEAVEVLDSVEQQFGRDARVELEKAVRGKGMAVEPAP